MENILSIEQHCSFESFMKDERNNFFSTANQKQVHHILAEVREKNTGLFIFVCVHIYENTPPISD